jgi:hypothetical protein
MPWGRIWCVAVFVVLGVLALVASSASASGVECADCSGTYSGAWSAQTQNTTPEGTQTSSMSLSWTEKLSTPPGSASGVWSLASAQGTISFMNTGDSSDDCTASLTPNLAVAADITEFGPQVEEGPSDIAVAAHPPTYWGGDTDPLGSSDNSHAGCDGNLDNTAYNSGFWTSFTGSSCHYAGPSQAEAMSFPSPFGASGASPPGTATTITDNCDVQGSDVFGATGTATLNSQLTLLAPGGNWTTTVMASVAARSSAVADEKKRKNLCPPRVQSVQFGGGNVSDVIRDQPAPPGSPVNFVEPPQTITEFPSGCGLPRAQWVNCDVSGAPNKVWPIIAPIGTKLTIAKAIFICKGDCQLNGAPVVGSTSLGLSFKGTVTGSGDRLTAVNLVSNKPLPRTVQVLRLTIKWRIKREPAGSSTHPIYVVGGKGPLPSVGDPAKFESVVQMATEAAMAKRASSEKEIFDAIWTKIRTLALTRFDLDPASGAVRPGSSLFYWYPNWTLDAQVSGLYMYPASCYLPSFAAIHLLSGPGSYGTCRDWAYYMVAALASQGIKSDGVDVADQPGFHEVVPSDANVMLIKNWTFLTSGGSFVTAKYPYQLVIDANGVIDSEGLRYTGTRSQGINDTPVGQFAPNDHWIVSYNGTLYDPSYGLPAGGTGYKDIRVWGHAALAGYGLEFADLSGPRRLGLCGPGNGDIEVPSGGECVLTAHKGVGS